MTDQLHVEGELIFSVDGPRGTTTGTVSGLGSTVTVHADDPVVAWDGAFASRNTGPGALRLLARRLDEQGLLVEVRGPAGLVAAVGSGVRSPLGAALVGTRHVQLGRPSAVRPLAVAWLRDRAGVAGRPAAVLAGAALLLAVRAVWRRSRAARGS